MFKHIKDGYYIVHNEIELMNAALSCNYNDEVKFKIRSNINYPTLVYFEMDFQDVSLNYSTLPLADLKEALGICDHVWTAEPDPRGYSRATLKYSKCGCNADHKLKASLGDECGI